MPQFIPGIELSRRFYTEVIGPAIQAAFPRLRYAAAHLGPGSDVLGFDTPMSMDHDWGPAVQIFLHDADAMAAPTILHVIEERLPLTFAGFPVDSTIGIDLFGDDADIVSGPIRQHRVRVLPLRDFVAAMLDHPLGAPLDAADWLTIPAQRLRELTAGAVHHDSTGDLTQLRAQMAFYPHDVWLYLMAASWARIGQEDHLMSRAGFAGDELGSALIGARLIHDLMQLAFLIERQYAPYPKWFGSAFRRLSCSGQLYPLLISAQRAPEWQLREAALVAAAEHLGELHNQLAITPAIDPAPERFFSRPFTVAPSGRFASALLQAITDPAMRRIAERRPIGGIDHWSDSTDLRSEIGWRRRLRALYE
jgi:hypothetical protein